MNNNTVFFVAWFSLAIGSALCAIWALYREDRAMQERFETVVWTLVTFAVFYEILAILNRGYI